MHNINTAEATATNANAVSSEETAQTITTNEINNFQNNSKASSAKQPVLQKVAKVSAPLLSPEEFFGAADLTTSTTSGAFFIDSANFGIPQEVAETVISAAILDLNILPECLREWIGDVSYRMGCAADYVAASALSIFSSIIGAGCGIRPKKKDSWLVIPNVWGAGIGPPSVFKSPAMAESVSILDILQADSLISYEAAFKKYKTDVRTYEIRKKAIEKEMDKAGTDELRTKRYKTGSKAANSLTMGDLERRLEDLDEPVAPIQRRYKTNDPTVEKLQVRLNENPRGLCFFRDELMGLFTSFDRDGREQDKAFWLETATGKGTYDAERMSGDRHCDNLCTTIFGGIQPDKLKTYIAKTVHGNDNDGFIQRLQLAVWPDVPEFQYVDEYADDEAKQRVVAIARFLAGMDFVAFGATLPAGEKHPYFKFDGEAQELFIQWYTDLQKRIRTEEDQIMVQHLGKYSSLMPSLALIFFLIELADAAKVGQEHPKAVTLTNAKSAISYCEYLKSHARKTYGMVGSSEDNAISSLAKAIKAGKLEDGFTLRDIERKGFAYLKDSSNRQFACDELVILGWLQEEFVPAAFRQKAFTRYRVNPALLEHS